MSLESVHPLYAATIEDQELMRAAYAGERVVKAFGERYLPPTPGMALDGMKVGDSGKAAYEAYKGRALFPDFVSDAVEALLGLLHQKPPVIELPAAMEPLRLRATADGESLHNLLRRINEQQLVTGRVGALLDLPVKPDPTAPLPFVSLYYAEALRNWDNGSDGKDVNRLEMVVLDESGFKRTNFDWTLEKRFRVLTLGTDSNGFNPGYTAALYVGDATFDPTSMETPVIRGKKLDHIPFVFINSKDVLPVPDNPPLLGLARIALAVYRGEADYRQTLFMQGQDTLVVIGGIKASNDGEETRVGAGAKLEVDMGGDAKYIGVSGQGLPELRMSLENDRKAAIAKTGQLIDAMGSQQESGEALKTRLAAQTATLNQIAQTGAAALESLLKSAATWLGLSPDSVSVKPNLEFADLQVDAKEFVDLMTAKNMGLPLSKESIHDHLKERGLTSKEFEEEMDLIDTEDPLQGTMAGGLATLPPPVAPGEEKDDEGDNKKPGKK